MWEELLHTQLNCEVDRYKRVQRVKRLRWFSIFNKNLLFNLPQTHNETLSRVLISVSSLVRTLIVNLRAYWSTACRELTPNAVKIPEYTSTGASPGPERASRDSRGDVLIFLHMLCMRKVGRTLLHSLLLSRPLVNKETAERETAGGSEGERGNEGLIKAQPSPSDTSLRSESIR